MGHLGVIVEDDTDFDVIRVLARRVTQSTRFGIYKRCENGCGVIPRKAEAWMRDLARNGCSHIVIVHDLDRDPNTRQLRDFGKLNAMLHALTPPPGVDRLVCIPVEELEAWFWACDATVKRVGRGKGEAAVSPHNIPMPKEALMRLSRSEGKRPRYSTNDNPKLAQTLDLAICAQRCKAFAELHGFLLKVAVEA